MAERDCCSTRLISTWVRIPNRNEPLFPSETTSYSHNFSKLQFLFTISICKKRIFFRFLFLFSSFLFPHYLLSRLPIFHYIYTHSLFLLYLLIYLLIPHYLFNNSLFLYQLFTHTLFPQRLFAHFQFPYHSPIFCPTYSPIFKLTLLPYPYPISPLLTHFLTFHYIYVTNFLLPQFLLTHFLFRKAKID